MTLREANLGTIFMEFSAKKNGEKQLTSSQQSLAVIMGFSGSGIRKAEKNGEDKW